jgi:serine/threonine protein kinase
MRVLQSGRYELLGVLGTGGMATVYRARDAEGGAMRAVKVLDDRFSHKAEILKRFEIEAMAMATLDHPNIVRLHDCQLEGSERYIVMDLIDGDSLLDQMKRGALTPEEAVRVMIPVVDALQAAHDKGIIHRDIKPHNILISKSGQVFVSDFGIARCIEESELSLTRTGMVMGTWAFMAPEQRADAKGVDHLADIYSVGATLYALITGEVPKDLFAAELDPSIYRGISKPLESVIRRACAYWNSDRFPTALAMKAELELTLSFIEKGGLQGSKFDGIQFRTNPDFQRDVQPPPTSTAGVTQHPGIARSVPASRKVPAAIHRSSASARPKPPEQTRVGWFIAAIVFAAGSLMIWFIQDLSKFTDEPAQREAVELPAAKRKGRIPSDGGIKNVKGRPVLAHEEIKTVEMGGDLVWSVGVTGSDAYDKVQAWYRPQGTDSWNRAQLRRVGDGYKGSIEVDRMSSGGIEYWIEARPFRKGLPNLTQGTKKRPIRVFVH